MSVLETHLPQLILADVLDVPGGCVESQPAFAVDVGHPQRPLAVEDVRVAVGHRHQHFVQAHRCTPMCPKRFVPLSQSVLTGVGFSLLRIIPDDGSAALIHAVANSAN